MKREWTRDELADHWTLSPKELELLANKSGATRLGSAVLLKAATFEGRFFAVPAPRGSVMPSSVAGGRVVGMQPMGLRFSDESLPAAYDRLFSASFFGPWARVLIELAGVRAGEAVLDIATGPGTVARLAAERVGTSGRVLGIDLSGPMLEVARSKPGQPGAAAIDFVQRSADDPTGQPIFIVPLPNS